jgi:hypothetical protein
MLWARLKTRLVIIENTWMELPVVLSYEETNQSKTIVQVTRVEDTMSVREE